VAKKRRALGIERLEARETPDVSLFHAAPSPLQAPLDRLAAADPGPAVLMPPGAGQHLAAAGLTHNADYLQTLEKLFRSSADLDQLLDRSTLALPASRAEIEQQGWQFLSNYTQKALRNEEMKFGPLPDHEDILHQVFVEWRQEMGANHHALEQLLNKDSTERQALRTAVRRVLDHSRYEVRRQQQRATFTDQAAAPVKAGEQDWIDLQLDWALDGGKLAPRERQLLELRRQGLTFEEIGAELGLVKQRVSEMYDTTIHRLQTLYAD
jgi:RNA polymerase sigma factor (sigma-70 family)